MTQQKLNKMGDPDLKISFHSLRSHLTLSLLFPFRVAVPLRLGPFSWPKEENAKRKEKAEARNRYRTESRLGGKEVSLQLWMRILFGWPQPDGMDWLLLSLLAAWLWRDGGRRWGGEGLGKTYSRQNSSICPSIFPFVLGYSVSPNPPPSTGLIGAMRKGNRHSDSALKESRIPQGR